MINAEKPACAAHVRQVTVQHRLGVAAEMASPWTCQLGEGFADSVGKLDRLSLAVMLVQVCGITSRG